MSNESENTCQEVKNENPYKIYHTNTGKLFYYNTNTNKSYWIVPKNDRKYFSSGNLQTISTLGNYLRLDKKDKKLFFELLEQCNMKESATMEDFDKKLGDNILYNAYGDAKDAFLNEFLKLRREKIAREENRNCELTMTQLLRKCLYSDYDPSYDYKAAVNFLAYNNYYWNIEKRREFYTNFLVNRFIHYHMLKGVEKNENNANRAEYVAKRIKSNELNSYGRGRNEGYEKVHEEGTMEKEGLDNIDEYRKRMNVSISNGEDMSEKRDAEHELEGKHSFHTLSNEVEEKKKKVIKDKWLCFISSDEHAYLSTKEVLTELLGVSNEKYNKLENFLYCKMDIDLKFSDVKNCDFLKQFDDIAILLVYRKICLSIFKLNDLMDDTENASLMKTYRIKLKDLIHEMYSNGLVYYRMEYEQFLKLVKNNLIVRILMIKDGVVREEFDYFITKNYERLKVYESNFTREMRKRLCKIDRQAIERYFINKGDDELEEGEIKL